MSHPKELNEKNQGIQHSTNSHVEPKNLHYHFYIYNQQLQILGLNPERLHWKHQEGPFELQGSWPKSSTTNINNNTQRFSAQNPITNSYQYHHNQKP